MASQNEGYWSRSWALLTRDKGWFKPLLVLAAAHLVPVVGPFGAGGYALEWGRLTAWGVDAAPKQRNVDVGACIKSGARAFVVALGYGLVLTLIYWLAERVFGETLGGLLTMAVGVLGYVLIRAATLRATIYQRIGAGYQVNRIYDMVVRDYKGLLRVVGMTCAIGATLAVVGSLLAGGALLAKIGSMIPHLMELERMSGSVDEWRVMEFIFGEIMGFLPILFVLGYVLGVGSELMNLLVTTATALWMRQFDVPNWGDSADPLPGSPVVPGAGAVPTYQAPTSPSPTAYPIPQPQDVAQPASDYQPAPDAAPAEEVPTVAEPVEEMPMVIAAPEEESEVAAAPEEGPDQPVRFGLEPKEAQQESLDEHASQDAGEPDVASSSPAVTDEQRAETIRENVDALVGHVEEEQTLQEEAARYARERMEAERQALDSLDELPTPEESTVPTFTLEEALAAEAQEPEQAEDVEDADTSNEGGERIVNVIDLSGGDSDEDE